MDHHADSLSCFEYVILGGGAAGLAAANHLADMGKRPLLIDAAAYPSHKVCGEFFSHECHRILEKWDLLPESIIDRVIYYVGSRAFEFLLPRPAGGVSRYTLDALLLERAKKLGALCWTQTEVEGLRFCMQSRYPFSVRLKNGVMVQAKQLFVGTGRLLSFLQQKKRPSMKYMGFKAHFAGLGSPNTLHFFLLQRGYLGISPVDQGVSNVAFLIENEEGGVSRDAESYLAQEGNNGAGQSLAEMLAGGTNVFGGWMRTEVPEFAAPFLVSPVPPNLYLIGDAAGGIVPASGYGLSMGICGGVLAVDCAIHNSHAAFARAWMAKYGRAIRWARRIHRLMRYPRITSVLLQAMRSCPGLFDFLYFRTRENPYM